MMSALLLLVSCVIKYGNSQTRSDGCDGEQPAPNGSNNEYTISHGGQERSYWVHIPTNYMQNSPTGQQLIFGLHGAGGTAQAFMNSFQMNPQSDQSNFLAVYPQGTSNSGSPTWNDLGCSGSPSATDGPTCDPFTVWPYDVEPECTDAQRCNWCTCTADDIGFINALLDEIENVYCIDKEREYLLGFSNGASFAQRAGCVFNERLAAVAPFHCTMPPGFNCKPLEGTPAMPIILVWGRSDTICPGQSYISSSGFYCLPVTSVMHAYGEHNQCNVDIAYSAIETSADGIQGWSCVGFDQGCNDEARVVSCGWNGAHSYPIQGNTNFGLTVVIDFFNQHIRHLNQTKRKYK